MKKYLLTLAAIVALTSAYAQPNGYDNEEGIKAAKRSEHYKPPQKSFKVEVNGDEKTFQLTVRTVADMPTASDLEISSFTVIRPTGRIPGAIALTLRPAGDAQITVVGPQQGSFNFNRGTPPEGVPNGRYLLTINGETYGLLVVTEDTVTLSQMRIKSKMREETGSDDASTQFVEEPADITQ